MLAWARTALPGKDAGHKNKHNGCTTVSAMYSAVKCDIAVWTRVRNGHHPVSHDPVNFYKIYQVKKLDNSPHHPVGTGHTMKQAFLKLKCRCPLVSLCVFTSFLPHTRHLPCGYETAHCNKGLSHRGYSSTITQDDLSWNSFLRFSELSTCTSYVPKTNVCTWPIKIITDGCS